MEFTLDEDTTQDITLTAYDRDMFDAVAQTLTYEITQQPSHGILTGNPPNVTYTPQADYHGDDKFWFKGWESGSLFSLGVIFKPPPCYAESIACD